MKLWIQILILTILDFIVIWFLVGEPHPSVSIGLLILVPLAIVFNLIVAGLFYTFKQQFAKAFLLNSIISAFIMYYLFFAGIDRHQKRRYEGWSYQIGDTTFSLTIYKLDTTFIATYSLNSGSSSSFLSGQYTKRNDIIELNSELGKFTIKNNVLTGFRNYESIRLTEIEY